MDHSLGNLTKCRKAIEIQKEWKPMVGDWFWKPDGISYGLWLIAEIRSDILYCSGERMYHKPFDGKLVEFRMPEFYTWLPMQDQLQEMVLHEIGTAKDNFWTDLARLNKWAFEEKFMDDIPQSMEQLWLAFVMKERYNKVWTGEDWRQR